jgi:hypothetical protein
MTTGRVLSLTVAILILVVASGCGKGGGQTPSVTLRGKVTLDGVPLSKGEIVFASVDKDAPTEPAIGEINDGQFSITMPAGSKKVQITSQKVIGKRKKYKDDPKSPEVDETTEAIPDKYNKKSTLLVDVAPSDTELKTFELKSK